MRLTKTVSTLEQKLAVRLETIKNLDLSMVGKKLMEPAPEGKGWNAEQVASADMWYRRYLAIIVKFPEHTHVPNGPIDAFWHQHILDTKAYAKDCQEVFGYFLHHYPYFGLGGNKTELNQCFDATNSLYEQMFGENCRHMAGFEVTKGKDCCNDCSCADGERTKKNHPNTTQLLPHESLPMNELCPTSCNSGGSGTGCGQGCSKGK